MKGVRNGACVRPGWVSFISALALLALPACQSVKTRTFGADRAGAENAIRIALNQDRPTSLELVLKGEPAPALAARWTVTAFIRGDEAAGGVVGLLRDLDLPLERRSQTFDPTPEGLKAAADFMKESGGLRRVVLRYPNSGSGELYTWRWYTKPPASVIPFETGVCSEFDCADYGDIRAVWVVVHFSTENRRFGPYPATRAGIAEAMGVAEVRRGQVAIEMPIQGSATREAHLSNVSVLEDGRICGEAYESPLGVEERCYPYSRIAAFSVRDRNTNLADALGDVAIFPFRLVGAAAVATVMGAAGN